MPPTLRLLVVAAISASAVAAPVPKQLKRADATSILGEWQEVKADAAGEPTGTPTGYVWRFEAGGRAAVVWPDGTVVAATYHLDDTGNPGKYDWTLTQHAARFVGLYSLRGNTLRTVVVSAGRERPTEVLPVPAAEYRTFVRAKSD